MSTSPGTPAAGNAFLAAPRRRVREERRSVLRAGPAEGWLSIVLLVIMGVTVGLAMDDARWVLGREHLSDMLPWAVVMGIAAGYIGAKVGWPRWVTHLVGAVFAALLLSIIVGSFLEPKGFVADWFGAMARALGNVYLDVAVRGRTTTQQLGHWMLFLAALCWATGQFAAYAAYGHRRPGAAIAALGAVLVVNMAITIREQLPLLVAFSLAALLFLVQFHALDEARTWQRHRIEEASAAIGRFLRAGAGFVTVAVVAALLLTISASSAPLAGAWRGFDQRLAEWGSQFSRLIPAGGGTRVGGLAFGSSATITGVWVSDDTPILRVAMSAPDRYSWRVQTFDRFTGNGWTWAATEDRQVAGGQPVLEGLTDAPLERPTRRAVTFRVEPTASAPRLVVSPSSPMSVDRPVRLTSMVRDGGSFFASMTLEQGLDPYEVTALIPSVDPRDPNALTANRLRAAGEAYPAAITAAYTEILPGTVGPETEDLLDQIKELSGAANPYDVARAIEGYLRSDVFHYNPDVTGIDCGGRNVVDCFAVTKQGYCEYYASTMVMLLRLEGIPARLVLGFLPGERDDANVETIRRNNSHAWVDVYFPGYGWVEFDPTGGGIGRDLSIAPGPAVESAAPSQAFSSPFDDGPPGPDRPDPGDIIDQPGVSTSAPAGGLGPGVTFAALVLGLLGALALITVWLRRPPKPTDPDLAYGRIEQLARRLGFARRPTETVYEYAAALGHLVPSAAPDLQVVATAKVERSYGRRHLAMARLRAIGIAQRRARMRLLRLLVSRTPEARARRRMGHGRRRRPG